MKIKQATVAQIEKIHEVDGYPKDRVVGDHTFHRMSVNEKAVMYVKYNGDHDIVEFLVIERSNKRQIKFDAVRHYSTAYDKAYRKYFELNGE